MLIYHLNISFFNTSLALNNLFLNSSEIVLIIRNKCIVKFLDTNDKTNKKDKLIERQTNKNRTSLNNKKADLKDATNPS